MFALCLRARLASFAHAYAVAVQRRDETGNAQFVSKTRNPLQPHRVSSELPGRDEILLILVL